MTLADFLTPDQYDQYLSVDPLPDDLERRIDRAEMTLVDRYRQNVRTKQAQYFDIVATRKNAPVRLDGYAENEDGTPDIENIDPPLLHRIRDVVARIVEYKLDAPDRHVALESQGSRSKAYRTTGMPHTVYAPLRTYDLRTPLM